MSLAEAALGARGVLRLTTCGAVDDGKSTLLGRLLLDAGAVFEDHLAALLKASPEAESHGPDPALLFDGLEAEREQGITIDVAYRYFMTARRKFIVADAPGHEAHTRNMATAASNADVAVLVVDAARGASPQTRRHARIAGLVGVRRAIVALNKVDLIGFDPGRIAALEDEMRALCAAADLPVAAVVPLAGRSGDNVVNRSPRTPFYAGPTLLEALETVEGWERAAADAAFRMPVQFVMKPDAAPGGRGYGGRGYAGRGYAGMITSGRVRPGDKILIAHAAIPAEVARIVTADGDLEVAEAGDSVTITLTAEHDIARGDVLVAPDAPPPLTTRFTADLVCLAEGGLALARYELRCGTKAVAASVTAVVARERFGADAGSDDAPRDAAPALSMNDVARCELTLSRPLPLDRFAEHPATGSFLLVERHTGETMAAGMIRDLVETNVRPQSGSVSRAERSALMGHRPAVLWFTGLSGSGKSTIAEAVQRRLLTLGAHAYSLDGDNLRTGLNKDLGFGRDDRVENIRRVGEVARLFVDAGLIVTCAFISPFRLDRALVRDLIGEYFIEIYVDTPLDTCIARDPKGLYRRALAGQIGDFSGISSPYEPPLAPDLRLETIGTDPHALADQVIADLRARGVMP